MRRHVEIITVISGIVFALFFLIGCAPQITCEAPNVMVGNTCCLDIDENDECDSVDELEAVIEEEPSPEPEAKPAPAAQDSAEEQFAAAFESSWNKKNFNALYKMMDSSYKRKYSQEEFNFLMKRINEMTGVQSVSFKSMIGNNMEYIVTTGDDKLKVRGEVVKQDDGLKHKPFFIFVDPSVEEACRDEECYFSYVKITGNRNFCDRTGDRREECLSMFGVAKDLLAKMDDCVEIKEYYTKVDCLSELALDEKSIEPCWRIDYDKQRFECMGEVAAIDKDPALCKEYVDSHSIPGTRLQHAHCIMGYVRVTSDNDACKLIERKDDVVVGAMVENCDRLKFT
ncbi:TPA: hypothetical protein HA265_05665 [Candidatus Woesearchaeota archaeon]|nr:hypothetical protein [Candidatus Woesearchaeota archaeon]